jgi:hypothetical protein
MKHAKHMIGCGLMLAAVALIAIAGDGVPRWIPSLLVLACPVMMIWMVVAMSRDHRDDHIDAPDEHAHH